MNKLLELLEKNAEFSNAELASMTGLSELEVQTQIAQLKEQGIIKATKALVDWALLSSLRSPRSLKPALTILQRL